MTRAEPKTAGVELADVCSCEGYHCVRYLRSVVADGDADDDAVADVVADAVGDAVSVSRSRTPRRASLPYSHSRRHRYPQVSNTSP